MSIRALESAFGNCGNSTTNGGNMIKGCREKGFRRWIKEAPRPDVVEAMEKHASDPWSADIDPRYWGEDDPDQDEE